MITRLTPSQYRSTPWKNGGGVSIDIAGHGDTWRFGRTPITTAGPFSDYTGFNRVQVLIVGRGLVLDTPDGEIDVRAPFKPVRYTGETRIVSRLEAGPVEVVNLIGARAKVSVEMIVLDAGQSSTPGRGTLFVYSPTEASRVEVAGKLHDLAVDHCLRIEAAGPTMISCGSGRVLVASIT